MNKNCYRIIFSKAKNMFIAVAENIKSQTKTAGQSTNLNRAEKSDHTPFHQTWQVKGLVASMSLFTSFAPVYAQIQVAPNAQASQKASIGVGRNQQGQNVPVVNIQTPKNGVSHNVYNQFDVLQPGVVLNNSRNGAGSVIVGNVGANPYLQIGEARVILNEVNSSAASQFKGNLEVAGQRADVIIANPSGINIQGGGFINANKAIFTTAKTQLNPDGSVKQFVVDQGKVNVSSTGNNLGLGGINNNADYVDIYAKAVELNAQVHANQTLQVITGSNTMSNDLSTITPNQVNSTTPTFALDVKALGGMYANNIFIIGTDKGLGVRNAGTIQSPQTLVITSAGKIENTGALKNTSPQGSLLSISTGEGADIVSSGSMISNGNLLLESGRNITFDRARLEKNGVDNPNIISVSAKGDVNFKNSSNVQNFGQGGNLYIDAKNINLDSNMNIGVNGSIQLVADNNIRIQDSGNFSSVNDIYIQAKNDLNIENSKISANQGDINLVSNGTLNGKNIDINSKEGTLSIQSKLDLNLVPKKEITYDKRAPDIAVETYTKNVLTGLNGVNLVSSDLGKISLDNANISAENGVIQIYGGNGVDLKGQFITSIELAEYGFKFYVPMLTVDYNKISSKGFYLKSNKDLNMKYASINATGGEINIEALGKTTFINSILKSDKNIEIVSSDINSTGFRANSDQNIALQSKDSIFSKNSKYNAKGMISLVSDGNHIVEYSEISSKDLYLKSNKDLNLKDTSMNTIGGKIGIEVLGTSIFEKSNLKSNKNIEISSNEINSNFLNVNSDQHVAVKSKGLVSSKNSNFNANGVLSLVSDGVHSASETNYNGGAILVEAKKINENSTVSFKTTSTDILKNDADLNKLNGNLSIQTEETLKLTPTININAFGDLELVSKKGDLVVESQGGRKGRGSESLVSLISNKGGMKLEGNSVSIEAAKINAEKNIEIISSQGNLKIDAVKNTFQNRETLFNSREFLDAYENLKIQYRKSDGSFYLAEKEFFKKYPVAAINKITFGGGEGITNFTNLFTDQFLPLDQVYKFKTDDKYPDLFTDNSGYSHTGSNITSNSGNISLKSKKGISISGSELTAKAGTIDIEAQGPLDQTYTATATQGVGGQPKSFDASIIIDGTQDFYDKGNEYDANYSFKTLVNPTVLNGFNGVDLRTVGKTSKDNLVLQATGIVSQNGNVKIESFKNILFDAAIEQSYDRRTTTQKRRSWGGLKKKYITTKTENDNIDAASVEIQAKNISIESKEINNPNNSIDIYSGKFNAEGNISIRSGGNINFYTANNISISREDITKKSSFAGIKYNRSKTNSTRSQVSQIPATLKANYIGVKSGFDMELVGTEFKYLRGAEIESGGKIFIAPAITRIEDVVKKEKNSIVWQSMQDKGSITETAQLPSFNGPTAPTFQADGGISVQIPVGEKDQNKVQIRDEILKLANQPGNEYLKDFVNRNDVDWNKVILAQQDWDYKSQGLTGAGAAIIVIIVTVLTSGAASGAASAISGLTSGTLGAGAGAALGAGAGAAVTTLATQASISLINNGGDIGKTLKDLGSKESIKGLVTSIVTAGVIDKLGGTNFMSQLNGTGITERIAKNLIDSTASALVNSAINGGNLSDNLQAALMAGLANAIQGFASEKISGLQKGTNLDIDYVVHKIAHAAAGCLAGAIQKNCEAGALGASLGEVFAQAITGDKFNYTDQELIKIKNISKILAASVAAAVGYDVNIASNSAENALTNNWLATQQQIQKDLEYAKANNLGDIAIFVKYGALDSAQDKLTKAGFAAGVVYSAGSDAKGIVEAILSPIDTFNALKSIINDPQVRAQLTDSAFASLNTKIQRIDNNLKTGGLAQASQVGYDLGTLTWEAAGLLVLVKGAAAATAKLGSAGVKILENTVNAAKNSAAYTNPVLTGMSAVQSQKVINAARASIQSRNFNDVVLDPRLPDPAAGYGYKPKVLEGGTPNKQNSHVNGYKSELQLANEVAKIPNQIVLKYGDVVGRHGSDIISVDVSTGKVFLWDSKYRSANSNLGVSPTFLDGPKRISAINEAQNTIRASNLPANIKLQAIDNLEKGTFTTYTVATGNSKNSIVFNCINKVCK
ncbi:DUF637 domain-containing protein [Acinetobacter guillouiae]|uniref:DUF637 domain-containing protein n=1 Tax=Acinetobacter guillouiae TaxID=106649 RepID=A0A8X8KFA1_ACIGI|nr:DUF637 domain-containing protein [Acinetobacter guillouiae]MCF0265690.1 DUF637 domain-containing protein [Acinetobacter guillouiae]